MTRRRRAPGETYALVGPGDVSVPNFPTTRLHADAAVDAALREERPGLANPAQTTENVQV